MAYKRTPREAYNDQRKSAIRRGVGWQFTFEEWVSWWEANLGPDWFRLRGHKTDQYVMARKGDKGPYTKSNVRCALVQDNHNEYNLNKAGQKGKVHRPHLTDVVVIEIYKSADLYADIAKRFSLDVNSVHRIKCQKAYAKITANVEKGRRQ